MAEHPSLIRLARLADGSADVAEVESISEHLAVCESCRAAMVGVQGSIGRYQQVEGRHRELILASQQSWVSRFAPAMMALAVLLVVVIAWPGAKAPSADGLSSETPTGDLRAKGGATFELLLSRGDTAPTPINPTQILLQAGDGLQLRATAPSAGWTFAAIVDASGATTSLTPTANAVALPAGTSTPFTVRYVVDGRADAEHVVICLGPAPFDGTPLLSALRGVSRPVDRTSLASGVSTFGQAACDVLSLRASVNTGAWADGIRGADSETSP